MTRPSLILHFQSNKSIQKTASYQKLKYRLSILVNHLKCAVELVLFQSTIVHHVKIVATQREKSSKLNFMHSNFKLFVLNSENLFLFYWNELMHHR